MKEEHFINKNQEKWKKLEHYNYKLKNKSISSLSKNEIKEYTEIYHITAHQLAYARTHFGDNKTSKYLNHLMGISHNYFYIKENTAFSEVLNYFMKGFPQNVRDMGKYFWVSFGLFMLGAAICFIATIINPEFIGNFIPENQLEYIDFSTSTRDVNYPIFSAIIMTNNIRVCFLSFAWGISAGIGTIYVLILNGGVIGALTAFVFNSNGSMLNYWALILPHGFIELTAIFISGGAGLIIGKSLLIPGDMSRKHSLIKGGKQAVGIIPGIIIMLVIAGIIEGFITPLDVSSYSKLIFAFLTLLFLIIYFMFVGKDKKDVSQPPLSVGSATSNSR